MELVEKQDQRILGLVNSNHPSVANVLQTHKQHLCTLEAVQTLLKARGIGFVAITRELVASTLAAEHWDMVVTIGGDGTVLDVSHFVAPQIPVLGVNSAVSTSHGHFCLAQLGNLAEVCQQIFSGKRKAAHLLRLQLTVDGTPLNELVLNEVLIAHKELGETSRYTLKIGKREFTQKSDGLLIGTASGSTGWMRSYGAKILDAYSRRFQYVTRGLIVNDERERMQGAGILNKGHKVSVMSLMQDGVLLLDGRHIKYPFPRGSTLTLEPAASDFKLFLDASANEKYRTT